MYSPKTFKIEDETELFEFIEQWSFADLITTNEGELFVNHVPFVFDNSQNKLYGHLAVNNPQLGKFFYKVDWSILLVRADFNLYAAGILSKHKVLFDMRYH